LRNLYSLKYWGIFLCVLIGLICQSAYGSRLKLPSGIFYYQPAASVFGSEAVWVNPAGLARYNVSEFQLMADYNNDDFAKSWGTVVVREGLGIAYRKLDNLLGADYKEYVFAASMMMGRQLSFGGSYRYFKDGPDLFHKRHFWNIGLGGKAGNKFRWGAVFSNLNHNKINGIKTDAEQRYSLSYRPVGEKVTISTDIFLSTNTKLKNADFVCHVKFVPTPGLYVSGYLDNDKNFQIGVRANLLHYFVGGRHTSTKDGNDLGSTVFMGSTNAKQPSLIKEPARRLTLNLSGRPSENPPQPLWGRRPISWLSVILNIYRAAADPSISSMVITSRHLSMGLGQAQEFRNALRYFQSKGKKIICHLSYPNNISYYVASVCDSILIPPVSQLNLVGLRGELTFYGGTLNKLGIDVDLMRIGKYKSAAESFTNEEASQENKAQLNRILDNLYEQFVKGIAKGRRISKDSVKKLIDNGPYTSAEALKFGLVDGLSYRDDMRESLFSFTPVISFRRYLSDTLVNDSWNDKPTLAVVVADGEVTDDNGGYPFWGKESDVTPFKMEKAFDKTIKDPYVKGVVFRINSPGGLALAGDKIYHAAKKAVKSKPMVVSMGNVAASGGYYIAMPGSYIFADPATITGSIGIFGGKVELSKFYKKIDLGKELYTRGKYAGMMSDIRPFTEDERAKYFSQMKAMYEHFVKLVADNRNLPSDSIDHIAQGRVWTGEEALGNGLVNNLGGIKQALDFTAQRLQIKSYNIKILPEKRPFIILPGKSFFNMMASVMWRNKKKGNTFLNQIVPNNAELLFTRLPYDIEIQ